MMSMRTRCTPHLVAIALVIAALARPSTVQAASDGQATASSRQTADPKALLQTARMHIDKQEWEAAYELLSRAQAAAPRDVDVLYYLGIVTSRLAQIEFQRLFAMAPDSARVHQLMAESLETQERRSEAEAEYEAALRASPDLLDALLGLAKLKRLRLDCDGAIALYTKAEAVRPTFDGAFGLGTCYLREQNDKPALMHFERAVERDPKAAVAWVGLAGALLRFDRIPEAIAKLQHAIALEPDMREAYYLLGRAYQASGDRVRAQEAYAKAEQLRMAAPSPPPKP